MLIQEQCNKSFIQQIIGKIKPTVANTRVIIYYILKQSKETILQFCKGTTNVL